MNREHLRAFALRDWAAIAREKRAFQAALFQREGAQATIRAARELAAHAKALDASWPAPRERAADLANHVAVKALLDRAARFRNGRSLRDSDGDAIR